MNENFIDFSIRNLINFHESSAFLEEHFCLEWAGSSGVKFINYYWEKGGVKLLELGKDTLF